MTPNRPGRPKYGAKDKGLRAKGLKARDLGSTDLKVRVAELEKELRRVRAAQADAEVERDEYVDLYEAEPLPALTLDSAHAIRRINVAGTALLGQSAVELHARRLRSFVAEKDRSALAAALGRATSSGKLEKFRLNLAPRLAPSFPVHVWVRFSRYRSLFELRLVDLRDQERAEAETQRLTTAERTAREASAAKDKFIAVLSHELRTPLTPVLVTASALRAKGLPEPLGSVFAMIERNIAEEARLIDDLLDVNRIVRNRMQVDSKNGDVHAIAREAIANLKAELDAKGLRLDVELAADRHHANLDPLRLRQVFTNLVKNAIKFTPQGGHVSVKSWNKSNDIAVEVEDNGLGIDRETSEMLFQPFMEERTHQSGGLGLGLAISKGLIELQGGRIAAHSRGLGHGSRFVVELPTVPSTETFEQAAQTSQSEPPPPTARGGPPCVLLVDDHEDTLEILGDLLKEHGFTVEMANTVKAAQSVDLSGVDVIVSDIGLPDGSGIELMRDLRTRTDRPAIALSGFGMESDVRASEEAGFDLHLTKPVNLDRLLSAIQGLSRGRRSRSGKMTTGTESSPINPPPP